MLNGVTITTQEVLDKQRYLRAFLQGKIGDSNLREGSFFNDLVVKPAAYVALLVEKEAQRVVNSLDISRVSEVEDRSSAQVLDEIASNFFIERKAGTTSQGVATIVVSQRQGFVVPANTIFTRTTGVEFFYAGAGGLDQDLVVLGEDLLEEVGDDGELTGNYYYDIVVEGTVSFIGSSLSPGEFEGMNPAVDNLVRVHNKTAFSPAEGEETNSSLAQRIKGALTTRGMYSKSGIEAYLLDSLETCVSVSTTGADSSAMKRDILSINSTEVRILGKSNIYANLGYYQDTKNIDTVGTETSAPASVAKAADVRALGFSLISEVTTSDGREVVLKEKELLIDRAHGDALEASEYRLRYDTPTDTSGLTSLSGPIYCRTSLENMKILTRVEDQAVTFMSLLPKGHSLAETTASASDILPLGVDQLVYTPTVKNIYFSLKVRLREDRPGDLPESTVKADLASYISRYPATKEELNLSDVVHYIMEEYSSYIINIDLSSSSFTYSVLLPDGNKVFFKPTTSTSYSDSSPYYEYESTIVEYSLPDGYLESLQVSDSTSVVHCLASDISLGIVQ